MRAHRHHQTWRQTRHQQHRRGPQPGVHPLSRSSSGEDAAAPRSCTSTTPVLGSTSTTKLPGANDRAHARPMRAAPSRAQHPQAEPTGAPEGRRARRSARRPDAPAGPSAGPCHPPPATAADPATPTNATRAGNSPADRARSHGCGRTHRGRSQPGRDLRPVILRDQGEVETGQYHEPDQPLPHPHDHPASVPNPCRERRHATPTNTHDNFPPTARQNAATKPQRRPHGDESATPR